MKEKFNHNNTNFMTKDDKVEIIKGIYLVGLVQFLVIIGSIIAIVSFELK